MSRSRSFIREDSGSRQRITKKWGLKEQVFALLQLAHKMEGKLIHLGHSRYSFKVELPQFSDNMHSEVRKLLIAIFSVTVRSY